MGENIEFDCHERSKKPEFAPGILRLDNQAAGEGFEPPRTDPESAVLPLDEPASQNDGYFTTHGLQRQTCPGLI